MNEIQERERIFIDIFSNLDTTTHILPPRIDLPASDKFLTTEIGVKYIGNMLKDIDIRLYLAYLKILKDKIKFIDDYNVEESVCISETSAGITKNLEINVPNIKNGMDIMATAHELGHGLKMVTKLNNERHLHSDTLFDETISILFGRLCLERYINDFNYDSYAQQFEILNIQNAINCLNKIEEILPEYIKKQTALDNATAKIEKNSRRNDSKFNFLRYDVERLKKQLYMLISYPIGISLANVYDNFDKTQKEEYLELISKYLLNIKHIEFEMILAYFNIPFDVNYYIDNFKEYINKFEKQNNKVLVLGGRKQ